MPRAKGQNSLAKNQLQLAIALSSSLEESKTRELSKQAEELPADAIEDGAIPHNIKQMQREFLERLQPKPVSGPARRTRKVVSSAIPTLLSRSSEERLRIITEKVALVLIKDDNETEYPVAQSNKNTLTQQDNKENILWQKASECLTDNNRRSYYVDSLSLYLRPEQPKMNEWRDPRLHGESSAVNEWRDPRSLGESSTLNEWTDRRLHGESSAVNEWRDRRSRGKSSAMNEWRDPLLHSESSAVNEWGDPQFLGESSAINEWRDPRLHGESSAVNEWGDPQFLGESSAMNEWNDPQSHSESSAVNKWRYSRSLGESSAVYEWRYPQSHGESSAIDGSSDLRSHDESLARRVEYLPASPYGNHDEDGDSETHFWKWLRVREPSAKEDRYFHELQMNWARLVNHWIMSDVSIVIKGREKLWAHKLVLSVQCPLILDDLGEGNHLQWSDIPRPVALAFLAFNYTGRVVPVRFLGSVANLNSYLQLSNRYHIENPQEYLSFLNDSHTEESVDDLQVAPHAVGNVSTDLFAGMDESIVPTSALVHLQGSLQFKVDLDKTVGNQAVSSPSSEQLVNRPSASSTAAAVINLDSDSDDDKLVHSFFGSLLPSPPSPPHLPLVPMAPMNSSATTKLGSLLPSPPSPPLLPMVPMAPMNSSATTKLDSLPPSPPLLCTTTGCDNLTQPGVLSMHHVPACPSYVEQHRSNSPSDLSLSCGQVSVRGSLSPSRRALHETTLDDITTFVKRPSRDGEHSSRDVEVIVLDDGVEELVCSKRKLEGSEEEELVDCGTAKKPCTGEVPARESSASPSPTSVGRASSPGITPEREVAGRFENSFESYAKETDSHVSTNCANMLQILREDLAVISNVVEQVLSHSRSPSVEPVDREPVLSDAPEEDNLFVFNTNDSFLTSCSAELKQSFSAITFGSPLRTPLTDVKTSSPVTPMPDYSAMTFDELHNHLLKYGLKGSLKPNQAIQLLENIYRKLHPLVEVQTLRGKQLFVPLKDQPSTNAAATLRRLPPRLLDFDQANTGSASTSPTSTSSSSDEDMEVAAESVSHLDAEQASEQGIFDLKEELRKWIASQPDLHESALQYNPLFLNTTLNDLKKHLNGNKALTLHKLMNELDKNCIMFRAMQQSAGNSRRRKSPNKSPKKDSEMAEGEESDSEAES